MEQEFLELLDYEVIDEITAQGLHCRFYQTAFMSLEGQVTLADYTLYDDGDYFIDSLTPIN